MALYSDSQWSRAEHGCLVDGNWSDPLHESGCDTDHHELLCTLSHSSHYSSAYPDLSYCTHPAASVLKSKNDDDDKDEDISEGDDDDDEHIHCWYKVGRTLQTLETSKSLENDGTLISNTDIASGQKLACPSVPEAYFHSQFNTASSLCSNDRPSLPDRSHVGGCSSLPASDLLVLDDDPQMSFLPLFSKLRQKVSCLDNGCHEELPVTSQQRKEKPKGHSRPSQLSTWSQFSSSDESDNHWFHPTLGHRRRHCSGIRRPKSDGRQTENWWAKSCSEEPDCYAVDKVSVNHHRSGSRRRQKKASAEKMKKTSSLLDNKLPSDVVLPLPVQAGLTKEQPNWLRDFTSFADCLADVEFNGTDSDDGCVNDDGDSEDYDCRKTVIADGASSTLVAPVACSFHCIPPESVEKQTLTYSASCHSPVCDKDDDCMSSEGELSASLANIHISDHDSYQSSCSFGGILQKLLLFTCRLLFLVAVTKHYFNCESFRWPIMLSCKCCFIQWRMIS